MISVVADNGVAALPGKRWLGGPYTSWHILLDRGFYSAIRGRHWCWLKPWINKNWQTWDPLPPRASSPLIESEYLPINITTHASLDNPEYTFGAPAETVLQNLSIHAERALLPDVISTNVPATWYCYDPQYWSKWDTYIQSNRQENAGPFPFVGNIRMQYNYAGSDVKMKVSALSAENLFNNTQHTVTWVTAAKAFGSLDGSVLPQSYGVILPATFHDVRLIPYDTAISPDGGGVADPIEHFTIHLPDYYMKYGPDSIRDLAEKCSYCKDLLLWEDAAFHQAGVTYLSTNNCPESGFGHGGGGSSHGH
jgi:hypothetical protein